MGQKTDEESDVAIVDKQKIQRPPKYKVLLHNDDYTTMEFVVLILKMFFNKNHQEAFAVMMEVHNNGHGICGIYTKEIAETKAMKVQQYSRENGHPLKCTTEPE